MAKMALFEAGRRRAHWLNARNVRTVAGGRLLLGFLHERQPVGKVLGPL